MEKEKRKTKITTDIDLKSVVGILFIAGTVVILSVFVVKCSTIMKESGDKRSIQVAAIQEAKERNNYIFPVTDKEVVTTGYYGKVVKNRVYYDVEYFVDGQTYTVRYYEDVPEQIFNDLRVGDMFDTRNLIKATPTELPEG